MRNTENIQRLKARVHASMGRIRPVETEAEEDDLDINPAWKLPAETVMAMSEADYRQAFVDLEHDNCHSECIVLEAKRTGNEAFVTEAEALLAEHMKAGELTSPIHERRKALSKAMTAHQTPTTTN